MHRPQQDGRDIQAPGKEIVPEDEFVDKQNRGKMWWWGWLCRKKCLAPMHRGLVQTQEPRYNPCSQCKHLQFQNSRTQLKSIPTEQTSANPGKILPYRASICSSRTPGRWETEAGKSPEPHRPVYTGRKQQRDPVSLKVEVKGLHLSCSLTSTPTMAHSCSHHTLTHTRNMEMGELAAEFTLPVWFGNSRRKSNLMCFYQR